MRWGTKLNKYQLDQSDNFNLSVNDEFSAFVQYIEDTGHPVYVRVPQKKSYSFSATDTENIPNVFLMIHYATGGTHGDGHGSSTPYQNSPADFPKFDAWEQVLCMFWPELPYLGQKKLEEAVITNESWSVNEYYGDSTTYMSHMIDLEKLFKVFKKENKLTPNPPEKTFNRFKDFLEQDTTSLVNLKSVGSSASPKVKIK